MPQIVIRMTEDEPAHSVAARLFGHLSTTIQARQEQLPTSGDPEVLHEYRTSLRRARALLRGFRGVLRKKLRRQYLDSLRVVQHATGTARDLDVFIDDLPALWATLPAPFQNHIDAARNVVTEWRTEVQADMLATLQSDTTLDTLSSWRELVDQMQAADETILGPRAHEPVVAYSRSELARAIQDFFRMDAVMTVSTQPTDLHRLRIRGKRLRYWIEAFRPIFPLSSVDALLATLKRVQDRLGRFNDRARQIELIDDCLLRMDSDWSRMHVVHPGGSHDGTSPGSDSYHAFAQGPDRPLDPAERAAVSGGFRYLLEMQRAELLQGWESTLDGVNLLRKPTNLHRLRRLVHHGQTHPTIDMHGLRSHRSSG